MKHRLLATILISAVTMATLGNSLVVAAQDASRIDVTGTWIFQVETQAGSGTPTVTFKQSGDKLTGHYSSTNLGEADLMGTVKGRAIAFTFAASVQGMTLDVAYSGTIESNNAIKGKINIVGLAEGTFTAKRQ